MTLGPQFTRAKNLHGKQNVDAIFDEHPIRGTPWPQASHSSSRHDYDKDAVKHALSSPAELHDVDPVNLHATQPSITRSGVKHYMGPQFADTYADKGNVGNKHPVIYQRDDGQNLILTGHHRATAALLKGESLRARVVKGSWGADRK